MNEYENEGWHHKKLSEVERDNGGWFHCPACNSTMSLQSKRGKTTRFKCMKCAYLLEIEE